MTDRDVTPIRGAVRIGSGLLLAGAVMAILIFGDRNGFLDGVLPRIWVQTKPSHLAICVIFFLVGGRLLWGVRDLHDVGSGQLPSVPFGSVRLITRSDCPLCDEALQVLRRYQQRLPEIELVDVDSDPELRKLYSNCVPVVIMDGKVRFRGTVNAMLLRRLIDARAAQGPAKRTEVHVVTDARNKTCSMHQPDRRRNTGDT